MKKGKFVVIEGPDGVGKTTQVRLLSGFLKRQCIKFKFIHFPRYKKKPYGEIISMYLRGEFGSADKVSPYLASLLYACDRKEADRQIRDVINKGIHLIADRHYLSNLAYQSVKINNIQEQDRFVRWLNELEFKINKILKPDIYLFLDAPLEFVLSQNNKLRSGVERDYLSNGCDIHEVDRDYQSRVFNKYKTLALKMKDITVIRCYNRNGEILKPKEISNIIIEELYKKRIL
ncbi:MAG: dTMP kinase [Thermodesulfovibrionales bacterium]|nr:dTMP kinase [Thermodesulfovibrionales bacterium]